jgi:nucleolar protein 58
LVGSASGKNKGKVARVLAAKASLGVRVDALSEATKEGEAEPTEEERAAFGISSRQYLERKVRHLEGRPITFKTAGIAPTSSLSQPGKWDVKEARKYNVNADGLSGNEPPKSNGKGKGKADAMEIDTIAAAADAGDDSREGTDIEMEDAPVTNGSSKHHDKAARKAEKEEKSRRKEEKRAKKAAKEAKKAGKKLVEELDDSKKKRKREGEEAGEKKKKKKKAAV